MRSSFRNTLVLACILSLLAIPAFAAEVVKASAPAKPAAPPAPLTVGSALAKLDMVDESGKTTTVSLEKGVTAISFFNTMCSACRQELGLLDSLKKQKKNLVVLSVCVDVDGAKSLEVFKKGNPYPFGYYLDQDFKLAERFGMTYTPGLVVVKDGKIAYMKGGFMNSFTEEIAKVILK